MKNKLRGVFKVIYLIIRFNILLPFWILRRIQKGISDKLLFSITFRITATYVVLFLLTFTLMSVGIVISFNYYIQNNPPGDYIYLLCAILGIFQLIGLIFIVIFGSRASRRLLAPVKTMTKTVREISIQDLGMRLDVGSSKDELKELAQTFNEMLTRIEKSVEQQNRFTSDASHELRTPIAIIRGYADLLDRWGKDDRQILEESVTAIKSEAESMNALLEKLLFLARSDKRAQKIEKQPFPLHEVIDEILRETRLIDPNHQIESDTNEDISLVADRKLIKEAVRIFLENSIKFTPQGGVIRLNAYRKNQTVIISVEDSGIGIAKEDLPHIFDRFYRSDRSRTKASGGTGLGLAIAKWIIDNHGGKIQVWSAPDAGTAVRISLPST